AMPQGWHVLNLRTHRRGGEIDPPLSEGSRPITFFDHGAELHESLVDAWAREQLLAFTLYVQPTSPLFKLRGQLMVLHVGRLGASALLDAPDLPRWAREADLRFLRGALPGAIIAAAVTLTREG